MSDLSFDFEFWLLWRNVLSYSITCIGIVSALIAFSWYKNDKHNTVPYAVFIVGILWILLGYFPIEWGYHTDRANYGFQFLRFSNDNGNNNLNFHDSEVGFLYLNYILSRFFDVKQYFVATTGIYLINYFIAIYRFCRNKTYWLLVAVVLSMGFISYNLNTMRAGLAISFIVLGLSMYPSKIKMAIFLLIASSIHTSTVIPTLIIAICYFFDKTSLYYKLWIISIPISFIAGNTFNTLFATMGDDSRTEYLTSMGHAYNVGFRIDFILYSLVPMVIGAYYIFKAGVRDKFYQLIYNTYLLTNIFWILVIRANYSDRFAYLSWFLIPFILTYPLLTKHLKLQENIWLGLILAGETMFGLIH